MGGEKSEACPEVRAGVGLPDNAKVGSLMIAGHKAPINSALTWSVFIFTCVKGDKLRGATMWSPL